jgi:hypothetical protein
VNVSLDPRGGMAMEGNHHAVLDFGLENTIKLSAKVVRTARQRNEGTFAVSDGGQVAGRKVWKIEANFPRGGYNATVQKGETLWEVAKRTGQDMYLMLYLAKDCDDPDDPDEGDTIFVPRYYGAKAEFFLDQETFLPLRVTIWDWAGQVYESFEYRDLKLNPGLGPKDFDPDNPAYKY